MYTPLVEQLRWPGKQHTLSLMPHDNGSHAANALGGIAFGGEGNWTRASAVPASSLLSQNFAFPVCYTVIPGNYKKEMETARSGQDHSENGPVHRAQCLLALRLRLTYRVPAHSSHSVFLSQKKVLAHSCHT